MVFSPKIILLLSFFFLLMFKNPVFALRDNEFSERIIRGTEIIHVSLPQNANNDDVLNYIKKYINPSFNGGVSSFPSYNSTQYGSIHWYIKDNDDDLIAVYFDGGTRNERDENYDFVDLRWLGNGSHRMYCFWRMPEVNFLQHHDILKAKHAKNTNPLLQKIAESKKLKKFTIKEIMKKIAKKVTKKALKDVSFDNFLITGAAGVASEQLVNLVGDILEQNSDALEQASQAINWLENKIMSITDAVDDIPVVNNLAKGSLEALKTFGKATSYPVNIFNELGKNVFNENSYKEVENPWDVAENIGKGAVIAVESVAKASVNTVKDVAYGTKDAIWKFFGW